MAKQTMKFKATQYIIRAMHEMTYIDFDHIICDREETPEDIRTWWENLNWKTQRRYGYFWMDMLEQGYFLRERTPDFYYKWQLGEIFVEFWETRDREEAERIERERKFQEEYEAKLEEKRRESFWAIVKEVHAEAQEAPADDDSNDTPAPEETPVADTEPADDDYSDENHGNLAIELPQEYAVFNLHGGYEELANTMHNRLDMRFNLTTDLFGDNDEPVTIADIDDILDEDAYDGWRVFVDGWWDNELRLYAQRDGADSEDATPSLHSDWVMIDADHGYLTIGTPV